MFVKPSFFLNLPGWRWGSITQNPLVAVSRPLHSGVCETRQDIGLPVLHSEISDSGLLRTRGDQQYHKQLLNEPRVIERVDALCFLFLRFYESSVLMRFLFLSSFSAFFMLRMYNSVVRIGFESDSNRIRTGFEPESFLIFYMGTIRVVATCTIRVVPMGNEWRRRTFFFFCVG